MTEIRVIIAEDQVLLRRSLVELLHLDEEIRVVAEAADGEQAVAACRDLLPDVCLMDVQMPGTDGIAATELIMALALPTRVVMLTMHDLDEYVYAALRAGASGYLLKDSTPAAILRAVKAVHAGQSLLSPLALRGLVERYTPRLAPADTVDGLTQRQTEVLRLVGLGLSNREIEERLVISHATMKTHMAALLSRLGARDRAQLVIAAYALGLVTTATEDRLA